MYSKLGKNETPEVRIVSYTGDIFLITHNSFNGNYTLYSIEKDDTLNKIKTGGTPREYDDYIYSKGKPPKLKDVKEESPYEEVLVFSTAEELKKLGISSCEVDSNISIHNEKNLNEKLKHRSQNTSNKNKTKSKVKNKGNRGKLM